jgi:para-nitrobenzyl esterase
MSSACNFTSDAMPLIDAEKVGLDVQKRLGAASLDDMRQVPADKILALQAESQVGVSVQGVRAPPVIDGYFTTGTKQSVLQAHAFNDVPIIASSNHEDLNVSNPLLRAKTAAEYKAIAGQMYGVNAEAFLKLYPAATDADVPAVANKAARESGLETASRNCAKLQAQYNRSPAYIDLYSHVHPYAPGVKIADQDTATAGAYHTADMPYWFDTLDHYNMFRTTRVPQAWDRTLIDRMSGSLIAFAETGSPATADVKWPAWTAANEQKIEFGDSITVVKLDPQRMDWLAAHPAQPLANARPEPVRARD